MIWGNVLFEPSHGHILERIGWFLTVLLPRHLWASSLSAAGDSSCTLLMTDPKGRTNVQDTRGRGSHHLLSAKGRENDQFNRQGQQKKPSITWSLYGTVNTAERGTQSTPKNKWYSSNICSYFNSDIKQNQK